MYNFLLTLFRGTVLRAFVQPRSEPAPSTTPVGFRSQTSGCGQSSSEATVETGQVQDHMIEHSMLLDASDYYQSHELSDITIVLLEETAQIETSDETASKTMRLSDGTAAAAEQHSQPLAESLRIPGHKFLLCTSSGVCKTQISRWTEASSHELELLVPPGQLQIGELLVKCMYYPNPDLSNCSQLQLLQLLQLADRHDVPKAVLTASKQLASISSSDLEWDTVQAAYSLPPACPELEAYKQLFASVAERLQAELGDLEMVLNDEEQRQKLLNLPHLGLLQLLRDRRTKVASENTVVYVIHLWHQTQHEQHVEGLERGQQGALTQSVAASESPQAEQQYPTPEPIIQGHTGSAPASESPQAEEQYPTQEQMLQLVQLVRVQHCTQLYVATTMFGYPEIAQCFSQAEQLTACIYSGAGSDAERLRRLLGPCSAVVAQYPSWNEPQRPTSAMNVLEFRASVALSELQELTERSLAKWGHWSYIGLAEKSFKGRSVWMCFGVGFKDDGRVEVNPYFGLECLPEGSLASGLLEVKMLPAPQEHAGADVDVYNNDEFPLVLPHTYSADLDVLVGRTWAEIEEALRSMDLVHPDDSIHLVAEFQEPFL